MEPINKYKQLNINTLTANESLFWESFKITIPLNESIYSRKNKGNTAIHIAVFPTSTQTL